ncbi:MAG: hypothetical protein J6I61_12915 [Prevotella sp.]|nr:hypothetical protein [Prevotella sp.]
MWKRLWRKYIAPKWQLGIAEGPIHAFMQGNTEGVVWIENPYRDGWLADPFVLLVDEEHIELLVEDFRFADGQGRISKVLIDRHKMAITGRRVLLEGGHYSFPAILREDGKVMIYPEHSRQGRLDLYVYDADSETCSFVRTLSDQPLTDAVIYRGEIYSTAVPDANGRVLSKGNRKYCFDECIARNAGLFFEYEGKTYRPAQECNRWYGHALSIQLYENDSFREVVRISNVHTFNHFHGITAVDRKRSPFQWLYRLFGQTDL